MNTNQLFATTCLKRHWKGRAPHRLVSALTACLGWFGATAGTSAADWSVPARHRVETSPGSGQWEAVETRLTLDPKRTAVVICDMWDKHWCEGATRRVGEMAPRMNAVVHKARDSQSAFLSLKPLERRPPGRSSALSWQLQFPCFPLVNLFVMTP
jgi:hypothetical protein